MTGKLPSVRAIWRVPAETATCSVQADAHHAPP